MKLLTVLAVGVLELALLIFVLEATKGLQIIGVILALVSIIISLYLVVTTIETILK